MPAPSGAHVELTRFRGRTPVSARERTACAIRAAPEGGGPEGRVMSTFKYKSRARAASSRESTVADGAGNPVKSRGLVRPGDPADLQALVGLVSADQATPRSRRFQKNSSDRAARDASVICESARLQGHLGDSPCAFGASIRACG